MFRRNSNPSNYQSFDEGQSKPPAFRRISREAAAMPVPGTVIVSCGVCGARYQKWVGCEYFQCEGCGTLVTSVTHGVPAYHAPALAPPTSHVSVVVQQAPAPEKKKKKKKKKSKKDSSSSSESSSEDDSKRKQRHSHRRKLRDLEKQVQSLQANSASATAWPDWSEPWPPAAPDSRAGRHGYPQLMDSSPKANSDSWGQWPESSMSSSAKSPMSSSATPKESFANWHAPSNADFEAVGKSSSWSGNEWPPDSPWTGSSNAGAQPVPTNTMPLGSVAWGAQPPMTRASTWSAHESSTGLGSTHNPFSDAPRQSPNITVNVPRDIASMSSDQLMLLAQAKRFAEQQEQQKQPPLQLQFFKDGKNQPP